MLTRLATGLVLAPLVVWLVVAGPPWGVFLLLAGAAALCLSELCSMALPGRRLETVASVGLLLLLLVSVAAADTPVATLPTELGRWLSPLTVLGILLTMPGFVVLARPHPLEEAGPRLMAMWGGLLYIGGTFAFALVLGAEPGHLMLAFLVVWGGDTGAYFAGRSLGRHKLYELISPKKTMEGAAGGLISSVIGASLAWTFFPETFAPHGYGKMVLIGLGGGAIAIAGDLVQSALKRSYGVKDSGSILPGHGGMLDRLDAFVFTCPFLVLSLHT